jgi:hypothetical protein
MRSFLILVTISTLRFGGPCARSARAPTQVAHAPAHSLLPRFHSKIAARTDRDKFVARKANIVSSSYRKPEVPDGEFDTVSARTTCHILTPGKNWRINSIMSDIYTFIYP